MAEQSNLASPDMKGIPVQTLMVTELNELSTMRFDNIPVGCVYFVNDAGTGIVSLYKRSYNTDGNFPEGSVISARFPEFASVLQDSTPINLGQLLSTDAVVGAAGRIADLSSPTFNGNQENNFTVFATGDSLGHRAYESLAQTLEARIGVVGRALEALNYQTISGTVIDGSTAGQQRRRDIIGTGLTRQLQTGAIVVIGKNVSNASVPISVDSSTFYLATEAGGGVCDLERSSDNGATWEVLEANVSTDTPALGSLIKTYPHTYEGTLLRVTVTSGNVELIGAKMTATSRRGALLSLSSSGGNSVTAFNTQTDSIFNAVISDIDPHLVTSHMLESVEDIVNFPDYADRLRAAAPTADIVIVGEHDDSPESDREVTSTPILKGYVDNAVGFSFINTNELLGGWGGITARGWETNELGVLDPAHLHSDAWRAVAAVISTSLGLAQTDGGISLPRVRQTGGLTEYRTEQRGGSSIIETRDNDANEYYRMRFSWSNDRTGRDNYWQFERVDGDSSRNPLGFELVHLDDEERGFASVMRVSNQQEFYFGTSSTIDMSTLDARMTVAATLPGQAALDLQHTRGTDEEVQRWRSRDGTVQGSIDTDGLLVINNIQVNALPEYATDVAADADNTFPSGRFYKVTGSRSVQQKP